MESPFQKREKTHLVVLHCDPGCNNLFPLIILGSFFSLTMSDSSRSTPAEKSEAEAGDGACVKITKQALFALPFLFAIGALMYIGQNGSDSWFSGALASCIVATAFIFGVYVGGGVVFLCYALPFSPHFLFSFSGQSGNFSWHHQNGTKASIGFDIPADSKVYVRFSKLDGDVEAIKSSISALNTSMVDVNGRVQILERRVYDLERDQGSHVSLIQRGMTGVVGMPMAGIPMAGMPMGSMPMAGMPMAGANFVQPPRERRSRGEADSGTVATTPPSTPALGKRSDSANLPDQGMPSVSTA